MFKLRLRKKFHTCSSTDLFLTAIELNAEENCGRKKCTYFTLYDKKKPQQKLRILPSSIITHHSGAIINLVTLMSLSSYKSAPPPCCYEWLWEIKKYDNGVVSNVKTFIPIFATTHTHMYKNSMAIHTQTFCSSGRKVD
jgi:hypothetical protein